MSAKNEIKECLKIENRIERQTAIAGIITKALEPIGVTPIIVGGTAVEFYTLGQYATMDIDFVGDTNDEMKRIMEELGFERQGRFWQIPGTDIMVEFPSAKLDGAMDRVQPVEYKGKCAYFIGLEDLILNRVQEAEHWNYSGSEEWAVNLMVSHYEDIDWSYCHKKANEYGCLKKFEKIQRDAKKIKKLMDNEENDS